MARALVLGFIAVLFVSAPGCSGNDPDSLTKQSISQMNDLAAALEKKESQDTIKALAEKIKATNEKMEALKLSDEDKKKLQEKCKKEIEDVMKRIMTAALANPDAIAAMGSLACTPPKGNAGNAGNTGMAAQRSCRKRSDARHSDHTSWRNPLRRHWCDRCLNAARLSFRIIAILTRWRVGRA